MHVRNFVIGVLLATIVLAPASVSAKTSNETMLGLQAQIETLLTQLASMRTDNPTAEVVPVGGVQSPFVEVLSPNGGESYVAGSNKPLTISWRARKIPSGSTVCVTLMPTDQSSGFLWGNDGCIKAKNGVQKITSKLIRNSGYDLGPGTYSVRVTINPKPDGSGKDRAPVAEDDSDGTITLTGGDNPPVCTLQTSQRNTPLVAGDPITIAWASVNADYAVGPGGDKLPANGRETYRPDVTKTYTYTFYGPGGTATCEKRVEVDDAGTDPAEPDTTGSTADSMEASPLKGSKPLVVTFSGTVNGKKSCGGGNYMLAFGDGYTYDIPFPADLCRAQAYKTTHTYVKDGSYMSGLHRGKLSGGELVARRLIQVATPQQSSAQTTPAGSTTSTGTKTPITPVSDVLVPKKEVDMILEKSSTKQLPGAAYLAIEKQLQYLAEQVKELMDK